MQFGYSPGARESPGLSGEAVPRRLLLVGPRAELVHRHAHQEGLDPEGRLRLDERGYPRHLQLGEVAHEVEAAFHELVVLGFCDRNHKIRKAHADGVVPARCPFPWRVVLCDEGRARGRDDADSPRRRLKERPLRETSAQAAGTRAPGRTPRTRRPKPSARRARGSKRTTAPASSLLVGSDQTAAPTTDRRVDGRRRARRTRRGSPSVARKSPPNNRASPRRRPPAPRLPRLLFLCRRPRTAARGARPRRRETARRPARVPTRSCGR
mmetsp:Transcript_6826/g.20021  ORF Transcript_6826/g.20021 Transcript_6826/m.20021 type:complete len:267 (-) Transcript_6826:211-1011(-)